MRAFRYLSYLLLALGSVILVVGLASHFIAHPYELTHPGVMLSGVGVVFAALAHPALHPTTMVGVVAVALVAAGLWLTMRRHRSHTAR